MNEGSYRRRIRRLPSNPEQASRQFPLEEQRNFNQNPQSSNNFSQQERPYSEFSTSNLLEKLRSEQLYPQGLNRPNPDKTEVPSHSSTFQYGGPSNRILRPASVSGYSQEHQKSNLYDDLSLKSTKETNSLRNSSSITTDFEIVKPKASISFAKDSQTKLFSDGLSFSKKSQNTFDSFNSDLDDFSLPVTNKAYKDELENKIRKQLEEELAEFDTENVGSFYSSGYNYTENPSYNFTKMSSYKNPLEPNPSISSSKYENHTNMNSYRELNIAFSSKKSANEYSPLPDPASDFQDANQNKPLHNNPSEIEQKSLLGISRGYSNTASDSFSERKKSSIEAFSEYGGPGTSHLYSTPRVYSDKAETLHDSFPKSNVQSQILVDSDPTKSKNIALQIPPKPPLVPVSGERWSRRGRLGLAKPRRLNSTQNRLPELDDTEDQSIESNLSKQELNSSANKTRTAIDSSSQDENYMTLNKISQGSKFNHESTDNSDNYANGPQWSEYDDLNRDKVFKVNDQSEFSRKKTFSDNLSLHNSMSHNAADFQSQNIRENRNPSIQAGSKTSDFELVTPATNRPFHPTEPSNSTSSEKARPRSGSKTSMNSGDAVQPAQKSVPNNSGTSNSTKKRDAGSSSQISSFDPKKMIKVNNRVYTKVCLSGRGGSSKVYKVLGSKNELYAIKRVSLGKTDPLVIQGYMDECKLLRQLEGNPFIIQLYDSEVQKERGLFYMVMELGEIDLAGLIRRHGETPLSMNFIRLYWEQMLKAVQTIHEAKIVHSDLKPANFLLVKGSLKLIDFGIAKAIGNDTTNIHRDQQIGTVNYMSPEALLDTNAGNGKKLMKLGCSSDVWSLGCILYQLCYGCTPFSKLSMFQKLVAIPNPQHKISYPKYRAGMMQLMSSETDPNSPDYQPSSDHSALGRQPGEDVREEVPQEIIKVIETCLDRTPKKRPTIPELLCHKFLKPDIHDNTNDTWLKKEEISNLLKKLAGSNELIGRLQSISANSDDIQSENQYLQLASELLLRKEN
ncbi:hypothetical protein BB560_005874 [Smittium megazygosporum]|uniref:Protein kinase domain-containing protein n=1 Tax=Smittium megazygosporum TaxID=133381 RepID=A0A2T9YS94_9FUNG|nr:hypothetical protein BB560_005874 [Smittium megazygosporum]